MKSLFFKIFACFWASHVLIVALTIFLVSATGPLREAILATDGQPARATSPALTRRRPALASSAARPARPVMRLLLRLAAVFVVAGAVSFALARYLTAPAIKLRRATQLLAAGDLGTRVGPQMGRRRDELADLGRDFDLMAERMEGMMLAERRLLADISHELRSPLARLNVALFLASQGAGEDTRGFLNRIEGESARMDALIGQLLTLARLESSALESSASETRREPVDLSSLVEQIAANADFEARSRNRAVRVVTNERCQVAGSEELLHSAIENVVRNAARYTAENTSVEITLRRASRESSLPSGTFGPEKQRQKPSMHAPQHAALNDEDAPMQAVIAVRDYGPGVPEAALAFLFRPFYRVAKARERDSGGVGLGLSITARTVSLHHGQVTAANAPGGGLLVEIRLPLENPNGPAPLANH